MLMFTVLIFRHTRTAFAQAIRGMTHKVFTYGTLKTNEPNHHWLTDPQNGVSKFIAAGKTKNKYPLIIATKYNIPFVLHCPGQGHHVKVMLGRLDVLEDHPNYYERELDDIIIDNKGECQTVKCWLYFLKKYKQDLLKRPMLENYSSKGSHGLPYMESNNESTIEDLDNVIAE